MIFFLVFQIRCCIAAAIALQSKIARKRRKNLCDMKEVILDKMQETGIRIISFP